MKKSEFEQFALWVVKIGLWTIPFLPLYVSSSMLFPFITGKNFAFRIIVEIIFAFWVGLLVLKEEYRPRLTPLVKVATAFIVILFLADFFSPNPYRAFFSNYERMEGFLMLFHLYLYFLMLVSIFEKRDWMIFFHMTIFASIAVSYVALLQKLGYRQSIQGGFRVDSTIGNPAYLAAYLLFHVWLLTLFLYQWWRKWWRTAFYAAVLLFELTIIYFTATRGATLALVLMLVPFLAAVVWFWPRILKELGDWRRYFFTNLAIIGFELIVLYLIWTGFFQDPFLWLRMTGLYIKAAVTTATFFQIHTIFVVIILLYGFFVFKYWPQIKEGFSKAPHVTQKRDHSDLDETHGLGPYTGWSWGRIFACGILMVGILLPLFFWSIRDTSYIRSNQILNRLTNYSLQETTVQSRFHIWGMSARASLERPFLGWGQENYYLVFQKYFEPGLFAQEPWFDRPHNIIFDWLIHTGFPGLLLYLSLFGAAFWMMWRAVLRGAVFAWTGIVLSALFLSYLFQNIFVFDNLNTYLLFFAFLAFTEYSSSTTPAGAPPSRPRSNGSARASRAYAVTAILLIAFASVGYYIHFKPIKESQALIRALDLAQNNSQATLADFRKAFEEALSYNTFGDSEVREHLSNLARGVAENTSIPEESRKDFLQFSIDELKKEVVRPAKDVKHLLFLGALLSQKAAFDASAVIEAEAALKEAIEISPTKQIIYFQLAQLYLNLGKIDDAIATLRTAWDLDRNYHEAGANLLMLSLITGKPAIAEEVRSVLSVSALNPDVLARLGQVYRQVGDYTNALPVYERLREVNPMSFEDRLIYAALLGQAGRGEEARRVAEEARAIDPERGADVDRLLEALKQVP